MTTTTPLSPTTNNTLHHDDYRIALYYSYVTIDDVKNCISLQQELCFSLQLHGRIRISPEGINGVLSGLLANLGQYQAQTTSQLKLQQELDVKYCQLRSDLSVESQLFERLSVKATRQVVSLYDSPSTATIQEEESNSIVTVELQQQDQQVATDDSNEDTSQSLKNKKLSSLVLSPQQELVLHHSYKPAPHLTPSQWNRALLSTNNNNIVLVDARNVYESRLGHFHVEGIPTLLTNTRKYSYLPQVLEENLDLLKNKTVMMYCTGGVRCHQASIFLQSLLHAENNNNYGIYQLQGGIQRYLQQYGSVDSIQANNKTCLFRGKNFVFDPRRTDPMVGSVDVVGKCVICSSRHDDYDNGHAPCQHQEARCCKCRVLILICNNCRAGVQCWGEHNDDNKHALPLVYCGGLQQCIDEGNCSQATIVL